MHPEPPKCWIARINGQDDEPVGLGFLFDQGRLVTCAHVVAAALDHDEKSTKKPRGKVKICFPFIYPENPTEGRVVCWHPVSDQTVEDIAILELHNTPFDADELPDILSNQPRRKNRVKVFGYPIDYIKQGIWSYNLTGDQLPNGWWQVLPDRNSGRSIERGFSGSPIWDEDENALVGMVVARGCYHDGLGFIIPNKLIRKVCDYDHKISGNNLGHEFKANDRRPHDVFLSYTGKDKIQVIKIAEALKCKGIKIWLDEWELAPGISWQEAIGTAVKTVLSAVVFVGPGGVVPWEMREMRACLEEFNKRNLPIIPILLPGAPGALELPKFFKEFRWIDFRSGDRDQNLDTLIQNIKGTKQTVDAESLKSIQEEESGRLDHNLFRLVGVPKLPRYYQNRSEYKLLKNILISNQIKPVALIGKASGLHILGLQGMGGVGKSVLAAAVVKDPEVRRAYPDGVFWITLGQNPRAQIPILQAKLAQEFDAHIKSFRNIEDGRNKLEELICQKACLLVLDDVWDAQDADGFDVVGQNGRLLVTTRKEDVTRALNAEKMSLAELPLDEARTLLASYAGIEVQDLPKESNQIMRECGELPLALAMVGSMVRGKPSDRWKNVLAKLQNASLKKIRKQLPSNTTHENLYKLIQASVDDLRPEVRDRYYDLAVFPEDTQIPERALQAYWEPLGLDEYDVQDIIDTLLDSSLIRRNAMGRINLHDLQHDFVSLHAKSDDISAFHKRFVNAYRNKCKGIWYELVDDGYIYDHLAYHLEKIKYFDELEQLLMHFKWLEAKLAQSGCYSLITDFDKISENSVLRLIQGALRLSTNILEKDNTELASQLHGRLDIFRNPMLKPLLDLAKDAAKPPWLCPYLPCLEQPGGNLLLSLSGHYGMVTSIAVTPDAKHIISGSFDKTIKVWDLESGKDILTLSGHADWVSSVTITPDAKNIISGSSDKTIKVWDSESGKEIRTLSGHGGMVSSVAVTPDAKHIVSGSSDKTIKVWDLESGKQIRTLQGHTSWVYSVAVTQDVKHIISGSSDKTIKVWDLESGAQIHTFKGHAGLVYSVAVTQDSKHIISGSSDKTIKVWDLEFGKQIRTLQGHTSWVYSVAVTQDASHIISGSYDKTIKVWDLESGEQIRTLQGHDGLVTSVVITDEKYLISGSDDKTIKVWDLEAGEQNRAFKGHAGLVNSVAVTHDARYLISGSYDKTIKVWDLESGEQIRTLQGHDGFVTSVVVTQDTKHIISCSYDKTIKVWDLESGEQVRTLQGQSELVISVAVTHDARYIISGSIDNTIKVWDLESGEQIRTLYGHAGFVNSVVVTHDARYIISGSSDKTIKVWDLKTGKQIRTFKGHAELVNSVVTHDARHIISGSLDKTIKVWDLESGEQIRTLYGHAGLVTSIAVACDARHIISGSYDKTIKVWDLESGKCLSSFTGDSGVFSIGYSPHDLKIVAGTYSGKLYYLKWIKK